MAAAKAPPPTTIDTVFETILADIVRGRYPPGARLPAERELSRRLGASRPTLREALRRLTEWGLVEPRRGSGVVVQDRLEWSIEVLPAYIRYARPGPGESSIPELLKDLLNIRRRIIREMVFVVAGRIPHGAMEKPREAVARAWAARDDLREFTIEDFGVMRAIVEAANFLPAVWLLNRLSVIYLDIARSLTGTVDPPSDYLESHEVFLDALERGDVERAGEAIEAYLESLDAKIISVLEAFA
jgi:DNA-binding FadR family transcriptional regulator